MEELRELEKKKLSIESEMEALVEYLEQPGMPGISGNLVDAEGFPRADIDVFAVRTARHKLACLRTDHFEMMKQLEKGLHALHAQGAIRVPRGGESNGGMNGDAHDGPVSADLPPFAVVDQISEGSPAEEAGLQLWDQILLFGDVTAISSSSPFGWAVGVCLLSSLSIECEGRRLLPWGKKEGRQSA